VPTRPEAGGHGADHIAPKQHTRWLDLFADTFLLVVGKLWDLNNGLLLPDLLRVIPEYRTDLDDHAPV
jgi:hypothetical protein